MDSIKVLALNDDNHSKNYVTLGTYYHDCADFVKECLLKPHTVTYEIREVYICDSSDELATMDEDEFLRLFDLLDCTYRPEELFKQDEAKWVERNTAFELFWQNGEEWRYA